ncbi:MAG TPA: PSD1 and planctomycete cytochrome C domain-containing protein [Gemmataceae bacterium]|nr:PSD1 and planctomycete cytochrome C domain-containing protein [Gemmataceae bacterium]
MLRGWLCVVVFACVCAATAPAREAPPVLNFDHDIQPILVRCVQCHGPGKAKAGLRLNDRNGATAVLDSGNRAIVPGHPEQSELLRRVSSSDVAERMPPKGKPLTAGEIELLRRWITGGADWPAHWAYRPLVKPPTPRPATPAFALWARTPIDCFILEKLAEHGLAPTPEAEKRTLLRRVYLDLIGLPPTPEAIAAFLADASPDAYERVVDCLLASPHFGERYARHWMDIVHFAETHGHDQDRPRDNAWPYRDYLIHAFNADMPYARFVREQVAGDVLFPADPGAIVATGFLAAGPWDESSLRDIREDSIDREIGRNLDRDDIVTTVMNTFVSTTVHCARCHDHKFDPIRQEEYYSLQAVFAGIDKANRPYDLDPRVADRRRQLTEHKARLFALRSAPESNAPSGKPDERLDAAVQAEVAAWEKSVAATAGLWHVLEPTQCSSAQGATLTRQPDGSILSSGKRPERDTYTVVAHTDLQGITGIRLEVLTDASLPHHGPGRQDNGNLHLNEFAATAAPRDNPAAAKPLAWQSARSDFDQEGWAIGSAIDGNPATAWGIYPNVGKPHRAVFMLREPLSYRGSVLTFKLQQTHGGGHLIGRLRLSITTAPQPAVAEALPAAIAAILNVPFSGRTDRQRADLGGYYLEQKIERELAGLPAQHLVYCGTRTFAPDVSFAPAKAPRAIHLLKRGDVRTPGPLVQPGTLSCLPSLAHSFSLSDPSDEGSRRAALASWLVDPRNGLFWRSIVNRLWQYHFGRGLVDTPNDFGRMGTTPSHPELLDWLALALQENGGSLKQLQRMIVTSAVYRQSCKHNPAFAEIDADNRYLWRMNRHRLDAESIHDAVLQISGKLDVAMGGPSVKQFIQTPGVHVTPNVDYVNFDPDDRAQYRRSIYRFIFRTLPDPFMESLDCPDGSQLAPVRGASITALQALSMLNDKVIVRQSEHIAARAAAQTPDREKEVTLLYQWILGREPTAKEIQAVSGYARQHGLANACRVLLNSNEFVFVD